MGSLSRAACAWRVLPSGCTKEAGKFYGPSWREPHTWRGPAWLNGGPCHGLDIHIEGLNTLDLLKLGSVVPTNTLSSCWPGFISGPQLLKASAMLHRTKHLTIGRQV